MVDGVQLKFCGLRSLVDAGFADKLGADCLGFILHAASPRGITLTDFNNLRPNLPEGRKLVGVAVEPSPERLGKLVEAGFDRYQIHFRAEMEVATVRAWSELVGRDRLWLAPKRAPGTDFNQEWLTLTDTFLVDTFSKDKFGGTGETGDWGEFRSLRERFPGHRWILAGGLGPENVGEAIHQSGARFVDVNSGVEVAPGIKDHAKMKAVVLAIHQAMQKQQERVH